MPTLPPVNKSTGGEPNLMRQGHTTDGKQGTDPQMKGDVGPVRDLTVNGKGSSGPKGR